MHKPELGRAKDECLHGFYPIISDDYKMTINIIMLFIRLLRLIRFKFYFTILYTLFALR